MRGFTSKDNMYDNKLSERTLPPVTGLLNILHLTGTPRESRLEQTRPGSAKQWIDRPRKAIGKQVRVFRKTGRKQAIG